MDFSLSAIAYFATITVIDLAVKHIAWAIHQLDWISFDQLDTLCKWHKSIGYCLLFLLCAARLSLRWRGHLSCTWGYLVCVLCWLSPLSPKPYETCLCCRTAAHGQSTIGEDERNQHQHQPQRLQLAVLPSSLRSPETAQQDEGTETQTQSNGSSPSPSPTVIPSASPGEMHNGWKDMVGCSE